LVLCYTCLTMARNRTAFDEFFDEQIRDPEVASAYAEARAEVDQVDQFMRALEAARTSRGMSKAELARQSEMPAATVRRLLTAEDSNPTIATVLGILRPMGLGLQIVATVKGGASKGRQPAPRPGRSKPVRMVRKGTVRTKSKGRGGQAPARARR
jgi:DNA-binding phage protein